MTRPTERRPERGPEPRPRIITLDKRPDLAEKAFALIEATWPTFVLADDVSAQVAPRLVSELAHFQILLLDPDTEELIGVGVSAPLHWPAGAEPPAGWDAALERAAADLDAGRAPTISCALSATLARGHQGRGLSQLIIQTMKDIAHAHGLPELIAPVRPNHKPRYPLIPMERYIRWTTPGGAPFDPWVRTHWRGGADIIGVAPASMRVTGTVAEWEDWTGMRLPETGSYVVPGALVPVEIDVERDRGVYVEPNVWMRHRTDEPWANRPDPHPPASS